MKKISLKPWQRYVLVFVLVRVIFQGKPPYEVFPTAVYRIRKTSKRFRQRKEPKGGKEKNNVKLTAIWIKSNW